MAGAESTWRVVDHPAPERRTIGYELELVYLDAGLARFKGSGQSVDVRLEVTPQQWAEQGRPTLVTAAVHPGALVAEPTPQPVATEHPAVAALHAINAAIGNRSALGQASLGTVRGIVLDTLSELTGEDPEVLAADAAAYQVAADTELVLQHPAGG